MTDEKSAKEPKVTIESLAARVEYLERKQKVTTDAYEFAANEIRPLYGFGPVALIFDAIHKKLTD